MKSAVVLSLVLVAGVVYLSAPFSEELEVAPRYSSSEAILPMTFAHKDHTHTPCMHCHHNYVDDTGTQQCMVCHVSDDEVWPLFEEQFHDLCRGCHVEKQLAGEASGPTRECIACHVEDPHP